MSTAADIEFVGRPDATQAIQAALNAQRVADEAAQVADRLWGVAVEAMKGEL